MTSHTVSSALHEDWQLIAAVGIFAAAILVRLTISSGWPPALWFAVVTAGLIAAIMIRPDLRGSLLPLFICCSALYVSGLRVETLPENSIERQTFAHITGQVQAVELRQDRPIRLTMKITDTDKDIGLAEKNVQIYVRTEMPRDIQAGETIILDAIFDRMNGPIVPGGFDYARYNLLKGIAAQGFAASPVSRTSQTQNKTDIASLQQNWRDHIAQKIRQNMDPAYAGIAVSLITGQRQYLDTQTTTALRDTGLSHLLAISGLHMGLLTAAAFFIFELLFSSVPSLALRVLPRKLAGVAAWIFACIYLFISGGSTATVRAFIMVSIAIIAVLTDRRVVSRRSVALAALAIMVFDPAAVLNVSFHMSFAATAALVMVYEFWDTRKRQKPDRSLKSLPGKAGRTTTVFRKTVFYIAATAVTTLVAQIAVAPFALYHFQTLSLIGLLTNIVAIPLMAFVVMPAAFAALISIIIGIEPSVLLVMQEGLRLIMTSVEYARSLPGGVFYTQPYSSFLLSFMGVLIIIAAMLKHANGIKLWVAGALIAITSFTIKPADILIDNGGRVIALYDTNTANMAIAGGRRNGFRDTAWKQYWGINPEKQALRLTQTCDTRACLVENTNNVENAGEPGTDIRTAIIRTETLGETRLACSSRQIVISSYRHRRFCRGALLFLASEDIETYGPVGIWLHHQSADNSRDNTRARVKWSVPLPRK